MKKENSVQNQFAVIKRSNALIIAGVCLVLGFFLGYLSNSTFNKSSAVRKMTVKQPESVSQVPQVQQHQWDTAISALEQEVKKDPRNAEAWAKLGHTYFDSNNPEKAIRAYKKHLELNPNNADVWTDMGIMYRSLGNPDEAIRCFDKAIEINPRHQQSRYNKGIVLMHDLENPEAAVKTWEELVEFYPDAKTQDGRLLKDLINMFKNPPRPQE